MVKQFLKKKSKRQTTRRIKRIEKKVKEHHRKKRKEQKKNPNKRKQKDPGIPNSLPFKEVILKEAEDRKERIEAEREKQKQKRKKDREKLLAKKRNLEGLVKDAQKKTAEFERKKSDQKSGQGAFTGGKSLENSLKTFYKEFRKVVDAADVILEVLDARDPLGSRCTQMEEAVLSSGTDKRLVLVLNKIDLVPKQNVEAWLKHLKNEFPTVAFKASTQTQSEHLCQTKMHVAVKHVDLLKSSHCLGADILMKLLGNYCRNQDVKKTIRVGVVGFPNTGKSSIINSLKRTKTCNVGATPGVTKVMQEVQLDKHIRLLDSPGVVMAQGPSDTSTILRNCVKLETLQDPQGPVEAILKRCNKQQMMLHYNLPEYKDVNEFLSLMARRLGRLKKGGVPDIGRAARTVLQDWNIGKISYYTHPPEQASLPTHVSAELVAQMGKEFDIDSLLTDEAKVLQGLESKSTKHMLVDSLGPASVVMDEGDITALVAAKEGDGEQEDSGDEEMSDEEEEEEEAEEEEEEMEEKEETTSELQDVTVSVPGSKDRSRTSSQSSSKKSKTKKGGMEPAKPNVLQLNKGKKMDFKKMKKQRRRRDKVAGELSEAMTKAFDLELSSGGAAGDDNYDFSAHF